MVTVRPQPYLDIEYPAPINQIFSFWFAGAEFYSKADFASVYTFGSTVQIVCVIHFCNTVATAGLAFETNVLLFVAIFPNSFSMPFLQ